MSLSVKGPFHRKKFSHPGGGGTFILPDSMKPGGFILLSGTLVKCADIQPKGEVRTAGGPPSLVRAIDPFLRPLPQGPDAAFRSPRYPAP